MAGRKRDGPKRAVTRFMHDLDQNGSSSELTLFTATDPVTLTRVLINGTIATEASVGAIQTLRMELWREKVGASVPAMDTGGAVSYGANTDLYSRHKWIIMRESTSDGSVIVVKLELKGKRKLKTGDKLVAVFNGASSMILGGTLVGFVLET